MKKNSAACKAQAELRKAAIYPHSAVYAKEHGELEQYRASNNANLQCKEAIEAAVREHFDGMYLSREMFQQKKDGCIKVVLDPNAES